MVEHSDNLILKTLMDIKEDVGGVKADVQAVKETVAINSDTLTRIESKHNQDYLRFVADKENLDKRLTPLELDYKKRCENETENRAGFKKLFFQVASYIVATAIGGWLVTKGLLDKI